MKIGVRTEFEFRQVRNAAEAAMLVADGGELVALADAGFGWGSQRYSDAPAAWHAAVAAIMAAQEFQAARAAKADAERAEAERAAERSAAQNRANRVTAGLCASISEALLYKRQEQLAQAKAEYATFVATADAATVAHGHVATAIADAERAFAGPREFSVTDDAALSAVRSGKTTLSAIAAACGAQDDDAAFAVQRKLAALVVKRKLRQDRRGNYSVAA